MTVEWAPGFANMCVCIESMNTYIKFCKMNFHMAIKLLLDTQYSIYFFEVSRIVLCEIALIMYLKILNNIRVSSKYHSPVTCRNMTVTLSIE